MNDRNVEVLKEVLKNMSYEYDSRIKEYKILSMDDSLQSQTYYNAKVISCEEFKVRLDVILEEFFNEIVVSE